jgi:hypothetical protein
VLLTPEEKQLVTQYVKGLLHERLAGLEEAATPRLNVNAWADGPCLRFDAWLPDEAHALVDLLRAGRVADPLEATTAWLVARTVMNEFETGDNRAAAVTIFEKALFDVGAGEFVDLQKASNDAFGFLIENL